MTRLTVVFACMSMLACFPANAQPWLGSGTENDPYLIEDANDMQAIGADPNYWDAHFKLMKSIDLENRYPEDIFNIIGNLSSPFTGVFDGNGHVVSNFSYDPGPGYYDFVGIFGCVDGSGVKVKNLGLKNPTIGSAVDSDVGALVGNVNDGEILNCYAEEVHIASDSASVVGGLVGNNYGTINKCYTTGIVDGLAYCGGLVGVNYGGIISDSYSTANVTALYVSAKDHGGLVGQNWSSRSSINRCYSAGLVEHCYHDGGLVGRNFGTVENSFWDIETSGQSASEGGIPKTTAQLQTQSTFTSAGWDFATPIWKMTCEGCDYPKLWYQDAVYIILSPPVLDFQAFLPGPSPTSQDLLIRNFVPGSLNWQIAMAPDCDWLMVTPESGNSSDSFESVTVSIVTTDLSVGVYSSTLTVSDPNAMNTPQIVQVNLEVFGPEISVWPDVINFQTGKENPHPAGALLNISNSGYATLEWEINIPGSCGWLSAYPMTGTSTGEPNQVVLSVDSSGMDYGSYSCELTVSDLNATNNPQIVEVNLDILRPVIELSENNIEFSAQKGGLSPADHILLISNIGYDTLNWQITTGDDCEWLSVYPMMGQCSDEPNEVTLTVDANGLDNAFYNCQLTVSDPVAANNPQTVDVLLHVYTPGEIHVPAEYATIQAAVDAASDGDVIILQPQIYDEGQDDDIRFRDKSLTIRSANPDDPQVVAATVIEGVSLHFYGNGEGTNYVLEGLTIVGGWGIHADDVSLTVRNCSIRGVGMGMIFWICNVEVIGCTMANNGYWNSVWQEIPSSCIKFYETTATVKDSTITGNYGVGIGAEWSDVDVSNCLIAGNIGIPFFWFTSLGGGISNIGSNVNVSNCSLTGNEADVGGGIFSEAAGETIVTNSILWNNEADVGPQICLNDPCWPAPPSIMEVYYSDVQGGEGQVNVEVDSTLFWGQGNINADPNFVGLGYWDPNSTPGDSEDDFWVAGDYHLWSQAGRWEPNTWVIDAVTSSCIDAGDPNSDYWAEPWPNGGRINMGTYGNTPEASRGCGSIYDLQVIAADWLQSDSVTDIIPFPDGDGIVDLRDYAFLFEHWLCQEY